ncbi:MAG: response regulator [Bacteroidales bacterium]|nr:response regulator [Bacteroidales bacterium]
MGSSKIVINPISHEALELERKILVVEDDEISYSLIEEILETCNVKPVRAIDGEEAVALFKENESAYNLIFMDIRLPKLNGYEASQRIKEINPSVIIVAITAYGHSQCIIDCFNAGCDEFITKPFDINKIISLVDKYIVNK